VSAAHAEDVTATTDTLLRDRSAAKNLFFGEILEQNLFPYPRMRERDREMLGAMVDAIDDFLGDCQVLARVGDEDVGHTFPFRCIR